MYVFGSLTSPYVRLIRVLAQELSLPCDFKQISSVLSQDVDEAKQVDEHNPLMKVPTLVDGDTRVIESRIIANYLMRKAKKTGSKSAIKTDLNDEEENLLSIIYGISDSVLLIYIMGRVNPDVDVSQGYFARSTQRIESGLSYLDEHLSSDRDFGLVEITLICILDFIKGTKVYDWSNLETLVGVYNKHQDRASVTDSLKV